RLVFRKAEAPGRVALIIGTFIIDFQTTDFEPDAKIAKDLLDSFQRQHKMENAYALDEPMVTAGWSFAKMFMAGQLVEKIYASNESEVNSCKGKKFEDKFIAWIGMQLEKHGCGAQVKLAPEMKSTRF